MKIAEAGQSDKIILNRFVTENETGSFLQSWDWGEWQAALGRQVVRLKILDDSGNMTGAAQLIKMPLPLGKYYLYAPYGPVVDLRFKFEGLSLLIQELRSKFPDALFLRFEPKFLFDFQLKSSNIQLTKSANIQPGKTLAVDLSLEEEVLLSAMHPKTRYNIRLAQKHGVRVEKDLVVTPGHGLYYQEVVKLIVETAERQNYKGHSKKYYENLVDFFARKNGASGDITLCIYKALYENRLLASGIMVDFGATRTYLFGGSSESEKQVMAPYALHWQAMLDAKAQGLKHYDFWGLETASGKAAGFARFKAGFGGKVLEYAGALDAVFGKTGYWAYKLTRAGMRLLGR